VIDGRIFLGALASALLAAPLAAEGQQVGKVYRIGFLGNSTAALENRNAITWHLIHVLGKLEAGR
jgi:hypothetical protein